MLKNLRIRLTLLYAIAALILGAAVGGGTYSLVSFYFKESNDHALRVKMGLQFAALEIPLPLDLYGAVEQAGLVITLVPPENQSSPSHLESEVGEGLQESELADIYVIPLTLEGQLVEGFNTQLTTVPINMDAINQAITNGSDLRTIRVSNGTPVRILTYRVPNRTDVQVFQVGRYLSTQQQLLSQLLNAMIILGGVITIFIGAAAWILAGRTLRPTQKAWEKQQTFVANASHELRAPLTLIRAGVEVARRGSKSSDKDQLLNDVLADADYMNKLIEDLLQLSRLDAHELKLEMQSITVHVFLPEITRQLELSAKSRKVSIHQEIEELEIMADPTRLKQVILIVLDNALHSTPVGGKIMIRALREADMGKIVITDTGSGIPAEYAEKVFDRFYKIENSKNVAYKGSGLGLSIARSLTEAMNGKIAVNNKKSAGAEIILTFPLSK